MLFWEVDFKLCRSRELTKYKDLSWKLWCLSEVNNRKSNEKGKVILPLCWLGRRWLACKRSPCRFTPLRLVGHLKQPQSCHCTRPWAGWCSCFFNLSRVWHCKSTTFK